MQLYHTKEALLRSLDEQKAALGFVPTMGALHAGHLSLVAKSVAENPLTVVSIFVNPTQFNNSADLQNYPRTLEEDIKQLLPFADSLLVFAPPPEELYGTTLQTHSYDFGSLTQFMEGASRGRHFDGVATIIEKLFTLVSPQKAYFGEKDYQQLQIIRALTHQKKWPTTIVGCPIVREPNGLALSSRNALLSIEEKKQAILLYNTLNWATQHLNQNNLDEVAKKVQDDFQKNAAFQLDYFHIADAETLIPTQKMSVEKKYRAFIAATLNQIRLIDNMPINKI